ncbi:MAG: rhodanese-like domain-containing protein [Saprospiraceae bacterium]
MKLTILIIAILALIALACNAQTQSGNYTNIDVTTFKEKMNDSNVVLLDVRTPAEIATGKIEGAVSLDVKSDQFAQQIQQLDTTKTYLVYCRSGRRSVKACNLMDVVGFEKLYNLEGGYQAWKAAR